jgi:tetratricopeptide (TPR) repeat protein
MQKNPQQASAAFEILSALAERIECELADTKSTESTHDNDGLLASIDTAYEAFDRALTTEMDAQHTASLARVRDYPDCSEAWFSFAEVQRRQGKLDDAQMALQRAVELAPSYSTALVSLAAVHRAQGNFDLAVACGERALLCSVDEANTHRELGNSLRAAGRLHEAERAYRTSLQLEDDPNTHVALGLLLVWQNQIPAALSSFDAAHQAAGSAQKLADSPLPRIAHEADQVEYLRAQDLISAEFDDYAASLRALERNYRNPRQGQDVSDHGATTSAQSLHRFESVFHAGPSTTLSGAGVNPNLSTAKIQQDYLNAKPGMVCIDDFVTPQALQALRRYCHEAGVWKMGFPAGYIGAFLRDGFAPACLFQIAEELRLSLPNIFLDHRLLAAWAFKYDQRMLGINIHADPAVINVNFWITPDEANLDPSNGGLVVWDTAAPEDWSYADYNINVARMKRFIASSGAKAKRFAHRQNRAVIFNSALLHKTDTLNFKSGYENRRINITLLFGEARGMRHFY